MRFQVRAEHKGQEFRYDYVLPDFELDEMQVVPPVDPRDYFGKQDRLERRRRWIDMVSANIAHAFNGFLTQVSAQ